MDPTATPGSRVTMTTHMRSSLPTTAVMDAERGLIQLSYTDPTSGSETEFAVNYAADADCANNATLQRVIKHAEKPIRTPWPRNASPSRRPLASGVTEARGVTLNREALRTYTEQHC